MHGTGRLVFILAISFSGFFVATTAHTIASASELALSRTTQNDLVVAEENVVVAKQDAVLDQDVWELSTRHLIDRPRCIDPAAPGFRVHRFGSGSWQPKSIDEALDLDGRLPIIYVHGNFMTYDNARRRVLIINEYLRTRAVKPYRLILLSWPSQREPHPLLDVRENAIASECQALYLAWILERLGDAPQVSILGYSLGAKCVTGGLHLVSGGTIRGLQHDSLETGKNLQSTYRIGFVAPAVDRTWMLPSGKHRLATQRVEGVVNLYNHEDPVLRRFRFAESGSHSVAAGYQGFIGNPLIRQYDCNPCVGRTHDEQSYFRQCPHFGKILEHLLWNEFVGVCDKP